MNSAVTRLDQLLYAWLAEPDDRKFDHAFQRYYVVASESIVRYLTRRSSLTDLDCEQIAVDALLKFFGRVGRDRRQAARAVADALPRIQPLDFGPFHTRQLQRWTSDVGAFRQTSMSFTLPPEGDAHAWKTEIQSIAETITPLQRQGCHLLESARTAVSSVTEPRAPEARKADESNADLPETERPETDLPATDVNGIREFAVALRRAAEAGLANAATAETRQPGVLRFVDGTWTVVDALPLLRVPTNGYLFDIAQSLYLDECKSRGRKKRGGAGVDLGGVPMPTPFVLEDADPEDDDGASGGASALTAVGWAAESVAVADPAAEQIDEDFCEQFFAYLQKPLEDAEEEYRRAAANGKGRAERKRLDSLSQKNERLMSVLTMRIEGRTQEAIAEALGISRNQVKYIVELVQSAYDQFCAAARRVR